MDRFLAWIERVGNRLPHPFWIFFYLTVFVIVVSAVSEMAGVSVTHPVTGVTVSVQNLLSQHGLQRFVLEMVTNFSHFAPLGLVLVMLMGVSLAVHSGLLGTLLGRLTHVPRIMIFPIIVVTGIMGNLASDAGIVVVPPLAAVAFSKLKMNPLAGIILAYASCTAGFTATLIPRGTDVLLAGFTNEALEDPNQFVGATANLYFMIASVLMLAVVLAWVGKKFTVPACGDPSAEDETDRFETETCCERTQKKGLRWALTALVIYTALALMSLIPEDGFLRYDLSDVETVVRREVPDDAPLRRVMGSTEMTVEGGERKYAVVFEDQRLALDEIDADGLRDGATARIYIPDGDTAVDLKRAVRIEIMPEVMRGPFFRGMVAILFFFFAIPGTIYGIFIGKIKKLADIPAMMVKSVKGVSGLIVLMLMIGQFVALFQWSNLDRIVAIGGANLLNQMRLQGWPLLVVTSMTVMGLNVFLGSSAAKWAMLAPIVVPMFMLLDPPISPAVSQLAYRIGDSTTNGISPLYPYFPLALGWIREYRKDAGIGTLIRLLLPYAVFAGIAWMVLLVIWYLLGIPVGPGEAIR
jgi:aminobenzoyl-glutamate transport protein